MNWRLMISIVRQSVLPVVRYQCFRHRLKVMAALGAVVVGGVLWGAATPEAYAPTHYVLRWKNTGMCTVVRERPADRSKYKILWFTTLKRVAARKASELKESGRCRRAPLPRPQKRQQYQY